MVKEGIEAARKAFLEDLDKAEEETMKQWRKIPKEKVKKTLKDMLKAIRKYLE